MIGGQPGDERVPLTGQRRVELQEVWYWGKSPYSLTILLLDRLLGNFPLESFIC